MKMQFLSGGRLRVRKAFCLWQWRHKIFVGIAVPHVNRRDFGLNAAIAASRVGVTSPLLFLAELTRSCVSQGYFPGFSLARRNTAIAPTTRMRRK
jgi:hypothetical protein